MKITKFSIDHSTAVFVLIFCILIGGLISYRALPREAAPDVEFPLLIISTPYIGVSPADIETLVTQRMEKEFKGIRGIKKMTSTSAESVSLITLEFETGIEINDALQKVREEVDKVKPDLPPDVEDTTINEVSASDWPVLIANISADMDPMRLKLIGEEIQDELEKITGVLRVDLTGGVEREIQVLVDPLKMRQFGVSSDQVITTLQSENINLPGGSLKMGSMKYLLRVPGEFTNLETIRNLVIKAPEDQQVRIRDVAEVVDGYKEKATFSRLTTFETQPDGTLKSTTQPNISLSVVKRSGENIVEVADRAKEVILGYKRQMEPGVAVAILNDQSKDIRASVRDLENNIISGMLLVLAVLFFFMGGARNAFMVALSIPLSMLLTFLVLDAIGYTLNMVVLFSLILALGMIVDNGIVIVENIYRHAGEGKPLAQAALDGTGEVGWAVIASTATTVGAFLPMAFWPGVMGEFMGYLPVTVIITLLSSLFVALVINPTIAAVMLRVKGDAPESEYSVPDNGIYRFYRGAIEWSLGHRAVVMILSVVAFVASIVLFGAAKLGVEFFPAGTPEQFSIVVETADGSSLESTDETVKKIVDPLDGRLDEYYGFGKEEQAEIEQELGQGKQLIEAWVEDVGVGGSQGSVAGGQAPHYAQISVDLVAAEDQESSPDLFMDTLRRVYERVPGATIVINKPAKGPPAGKPVNIEIRGDNLAVMGHVAQQVKDRIRTVPGLIDLDDDVELTRPEIVVDVDRDEAALSKLDTRAIASTVRTAINGTKATVFREDEDEYDITVRLPEGMRQSVGDLELLTVVNKDGDQIPLTEIATIEVRGGTGSIRRKDQQRYVTVSANAASGFLAANVLAQAQERLEDYRPPAGYGLYYTGENDDQKEAAEFLLKALMIAAFVIILILVTQFNSVSQPFIIMTSVLFSIMGVLWSLILFRQPFGVIMTGIGVVSLAGVVVNNSIVMIDYANLLRARGMSRRESLVTSGLVRFRPVMLTASTTIIGLLPLVVGVSIDFVALDVVVGGSSVDIWGPMARAISSGLLVATILTLIVVPVMYSLNDDLGGLVNRLLGRDKTPPEDSGPHQDPTAVGATAEGPSTDGSLNGGGRTTTLLLFGLTAAALAGLLWLSPAPALAQVAQPPGLDDNPTTPDGPLEVDRPDPTEEVSRDLEREFDALDTDPSVEGGATFRVPKDVIRDGGFERSKDDLMELSFQTTRELGLEELQKMLGEQNFDVRIAMTNITVSEATLDKAWSTLFPSLSTSFQGTLNDQEIAIPLADPPAIVQNMVDYTFSARAAVRLDARAWPLIQQAYLLNDLSVQQVEALKEELTFALIQTYYNTLLSRRVLELAVDQLEGDRRNVRALEVRQKAGVVKAFEITRAKLRVSQSEQQVERARLGHEQLLITLANLVQTPADFQIKVPNEVTEPESVVALKESARTSRATVRAERTAVAVADKAHEEIYWQYLPTFELSANAVRPRGTVLNPGIWRYSLILSAQWILWDGGLREAELDEREAKLVEAKLKRQKTIADLDRDIEVAWVEYLSAKAQVEISQNQVQTAELSAQEINRAYELGAGLQLDQFGAQDQQRAAQVTLAQDELRLQLALQKLKYLAGKR